ncbi:MAG TPA: hypothetical protein VFX97_11935 [Pyrinomonadaceae bacterium]|nr:hypothetical protein [Pyrinomonadaceae bacterium]
MPTDLIRLINSIGKSTFVRYYENFRDSLLSNQDVIAILPEEYTLKSRISRTTKARRIFREGLEEEALEIISAAQGVDSDTANRAQELLRKLRQST